MAKLNETFPSWKEKLKPENMPMDVTIKSVDGKKISFEETSATLRMNMTIAKQIYAMTGDDETDNWAGTEFTLIWDKEKRGFRVKADKPNGKK